jgi:hypothetical protein
LFLAGVDLSQKVLSANNDRVTIVVLYYSFKYSAFFSVLLREKNQLNIHSGLGFLGVQSYFVTGSF